MKNKTYSRTSPTDGRRATLGANGRYSRRNNKGYLINQGIGNLLGTTGEVQLTNANTGNTVDSNTGNGGFESGGTNTGEVTNTTGYLVNNNANDGNNDGYGTVHYLNNVRTDDGYNIAGEYSIDIREFGTYATSTTVYPLAVQQLYVGQTTSLGNQSLYSQHGLADGTDGYVRYTGGIDRFIKTAGHRMAVEDSITNGGVTFRSLQMPYNQSQLNMTVYINNDTQTISVGDSIHLDNTGQTPLADGLTNNKPNRYWFMMPDPITGVPHVTKVTSGVVTHHYAWNSGLEGWRNHTDATTWVKQVYLGNNEYNNPPNDSATMQGKEWVGDAETGSLVTQNVFQVAVDEAQAQLNDGWSIQNTTTAGGNSGVWFDYRTDAQPYSVGKYVRKIEGTSAIISYQRATDNLEIEALALSYTGTAFGTPYTVDSSHKIGETRFKYLPLMGNMTSNFNYDDERKGIIVLEVLSYTGEIVNMEIVAKTNGIDNMQARDENGLALT